MAAALRRVAISSSLKSGELSFALKRAMVSGLAEATTSRERAAPGVLRRAPLVTRFSTCSATAETEVRPRPVMISR